MSAEASPARRIVLHVGSPKCGSTFLQQVMLGNAGALAAHGIAYPHSGGSHPGNAADIADLTAADVAALFAPGIHTIVLSHEDLYSLAKRGDALSKIARETGTQVQLVAFLRPFSEFVFGDYSQFMKQFFERFLKTRNPYDGRDFDAFAARRVETLRPAQFLRNWQSRFPETPLVLESHRRIRPVMEGLLGTEVPIDWDVPRARTNPSLRMEDCDRLAAAMRDPMVPAAAIRKMFKAAFSQVEEPDAGRTAARTARIEALFAAQNDALLRDFGFDNRLPPATEAREAAS